MPYQAVLLDAGETLLGPAGSFGAVYARILATHGIDRPVSMLEGALRSTWEGMNRTIPAGADRYRHFPGGEGGYWLRFVEQTLGGLGSAALPGELAQRLLDPLREAFRDPAAWIVYPDVVPTLRALRAGGVRLAVVSNWDSRLPGLLQSLGLSHYFETIVVSGLEGVEKPDPRLFRCALDRLGIDRRSAVHVGDVPELDLAGARAAGVHAVLVDRRGRLDPSLDAMRDLTPLPRLVLDPTR